MYKLPKLHLLSDPKSDLDLFSRVFRIGDHVYAQTGVGAVKFSALILRESGLLSTLPKECSISASDWKVLSDGFTQEDTLPLGEIEGVPTMHVLAKGKNPHEIELREVPSNICANIEMPYSPDRKPLIEGRSQTNLAMNPVTLRNITTACSSKGGGGLMTIEPLSGIDEDNISAKVIIEQPREYFIDAIVIADYRELEPVDGSDFPEEINKYYTDKLEEQKAAMAEAVQSETSDGGEISTFIPEGLDKESLSVKDFNPRTLEAEDVQKPVEITTSNEPLTVDEARQAEEEAESDDWML